MVVVPTKAGSVRIYVDIWWLNKSVLRETYPLPKVDKSHLHNYIAGATVFSKLDANSDIWQVPLDESSQELTTFITPFGRYCFNRLPFGISSTPEHFSASDGGYYTDTQNSACRMGVPFGYSSRGATAGSKPNSVPTLWGTPRNIPYEEFGKIICVVPRTGQGPRSSSKSLQPVSAVSTPPCHDSYPTLGILAIPAKE